MKDISEEQFEHHMQWSALGGTVATAKGAHSLMLKAAGEYFIGGKDDIASAIRRLAGEYLDTVVKPQSAELQKFINGDK